jgi:hypothetical protein
MGKEKTFPILEWHFRHKRCCKASIAAAKEAEII